jgi:hypothetical protein
MPAMLDLRAHHSQRRTSGMRAAIAPVMRLRRLRG